MLAKLLWLRKLFTVFVNIRQDRDFCEKCPIQLFIIMVVDVGTILFQLKSTVIASIEYFYKWLRQPNLGVALRKIAAASNIS